MDTTVRVGAYPYQSVEHVLYDIPYPNFLDFISSIWTWCAPLATSSSAQLAVGTYGHELNCMCLKYPSMFGVGICELAFHQARDRPA